jgi:hypothetical protein
MPCGQPPPSHLGGLRWPSGAIGYRPFLGVVIALREAGTHAGFRLLTPHVAQGSFALMVCYRHRHCYYNPMRQSPAHPHISRLFAGYSAGLSDETPSLRCISDLATVPPPLRRRAPQRHLPDSSLEILPSPHLHWLGAPNTPQLPSRGKTSRRCSDSVMLRPGHSLALLGSPVLRR